MLGVAGLGEYVIVVDALLGISHICLVIVEDSVGLSKSVWYLTCSDTLRGCRIREGRESGSFGREPGDSFRRGHTSMRGWALPGNGNMVKRNQGLRRMPWRIPAKKAAASCEKRRGGANTH